MSVSKRFDPYRDHQSEYVATEEPRLVRTEPGTYLTITGRSPAGGEEFERRVRTLRHALDSLHRHESNRGKNFVPGKLEALWWVKGVDRKTDEPLWHWKLMIRVPDFVSDKDWGVAADASRDENVKEVWLERIDEGECVQVLHVGPYEREQESVEKMRDFAQRLGKRFEGFHHEIYLTSPVDVPPEGQRTLLRQQVVPATLAP